eukprot:561507-Hanusia_phi.AAC.3
MTDVMTKGVIVKIVCERAGGRGLLMRTEPSGRRLLIACRDACSEAVVTLLDDPALNFEWRNGTRVRSPSLSLSSCRP